MPKEPHLFEIGDLVLMQNKCRRKEENPKLGAAHVGPYTVQEQLGGYTYLLACNGQISVQHRGRLKL